MNYKWDGLVVVLSQQWAWPIATVIIVGMITRLARYAIKTTKEDDQ